MTANAKVPTAEQVLGHLRKHDWTKADAEAFVARHADLVGIATLRRLGRPVRCLRRGERVIRQASSTTAIIFRPWWSVPNTSKSQVRVSMLTILTSGSASIALASFFNASSESEPITLRMCWVGIRGMSDGIAL